MTSNIPQGQWQQPYPQGPQGPYPPPQPPKKHTLRNVLIIIAIILVLLIGGCMATLHKAAESASDAISSISQSAEAPHTVSYKVTTSNAATITYVTGGGTSQEAVTADWEKELTFTGFNAVSVSVSSTDYQAENAAVSCEIIVDGSSVAKNSGTGLGASAICTATVG